MNEIGFIKRHLRQRLTPTFPETFYRLTDSTLRALRLDKALTQLRPGDVAMIEFGHNDQKPQNPLAYAEAETAYRSYLRLYIEEVRRRGARPMLVTSTHRRMFDSDGTIRNSHGDYPEAVRIVSREEGIPVIDLTEITRELYEAMGPERSRLAFANNGRDATHHNAYGAYLLAWAVADRLRELDDPIAAHISTAKPPLDLARPPSLEDVQLQLPPSPPTEAPAGS